MTQLERMKLLNEVLQLFSLEKDEAYSDTGGMWWRMGDETLTFRNNNDSAFDQAINRLLDSDCEIQNTISKQNFTNTFVHLLLEKKKTGERFTPSDWKTFRETLIAAPISEVRVLREIFGSSIANEPISISCFTIYDWKKHRHLIDGIENQNKLLWPDGGHGLLIECKTKARDTTKALELADILFTHFDSILCFMIGDPNRHLRIGILNYAGPQTSHHYLISNETVGGGTATTGPHQSLALDTADFLKPDAPFGRLIGLIDRERTELEERLIQSVTWVSESLLDVNPPSAFVKAAVALEVLFTGKEELVTPSILHQISERCALLLGSDAESCLQIERTVKALYKTRSSVVHAGKKSVSLADLDSIISIARDIIYTILSTDMYWNFERMDKLHHYLRLKKYSGVTQSN
jgi:hypothetical protein